MKKTGLFSAVFQSAGYIILFLACQVATSLLCEGFFSGLLLRQGLSGTEFVNRLNQLLNKNMYEMMLVSYLIFLGLAALILRKKFAVAIGAKKPEKLSLITSLLFGFGCFPIIITLFTYISSIPAVSQSQSQYNQQLEAISSAGSSLFFEILAVCIMGPIMEELLFRGLVQNSLKKATSPAFAIFLSALAFGLVHGNLYQLIFTLPLGIFMGFLAHRFQSLWCSVFLHIGFNSSNYLPRLGEFLGYGEESAVSQFLSYAALIFYYFALILAIILYRNYFAKKRSLPFGLAKREDDLTSVFLKEEKGEQDMAAPEFIIAGLGNPGSKYEKNRHNAGFLALDHLAEKENIPLKNLRFKALCGEGFIGGKKVLLLKPQTFMNLSGESLREAAAFYKIPAENILILFDDINFAPGIFRIREKGSAGGHNGIKSIISCLGSDNFPRVKMGVGAVPEGWDLMHHVLGNLPTEDMKKVQATFDDIADTARLFVKGEIQRAGALFNGKMHE